jgi:hypothetical protein
MGIILLLARHRGEGRCEPHEDMMHILHHNAPRAVNLEVGAICTLLLIYLNQPATVQITAIHCNNYFIKAQVLAQF